MGGDGVTRTERGLTTAARGCWHGPDASRSGPGTAAACGTPGGQRPHGRRGRPDRAGLGLMQTFLPYASFERSAEVLDGRRLGKQRVEAIQIVRALTVPTYAWKHHPATLMWQGHEEFLGWYGMLLVGAWRGRGFAAPVRRRSWPTSPPPGCPPAPRPSWPPPTCSRPGWATRPSTGVTSRRLVRKDPEHYGPRFPGVPGDLPYVWPVRSAKALEAERRREAGEAVRLSAAVRRRPPARGRTAGRS